MATTVIDGNKLKDLFMGGLSNLKLSADEINDLNVFPIPDGDTGSNMLMTIQGACRAVSEEENISLEDFGRKFSRGALLGARGNSGVILSQFIKGFSAGCTGKEVLTISDFTNAYKMGVDKAYEAVIKPTEGTMLTVMREGLEYIVNEGTNITNFHDYFERLLHRMDISLANTPELLPILKESGVIDSGGAGFICIFRGMQKVLNGEKIETAEDFSVTSAVTGIDASIFNADSELTFGYCTEFILQLQNKKVRILDFDLNELVNFLETIGNSIVAVQDEDLVKVHVHTFEPGKVLNFGQKYGEYISVKIENMSVQHNETTMFKKEKQSPKKKHKAIAIVAVVNGNGLKNYFEDLGVDICVDGGQTENPSTEDFIQAFELIDADNIIVLPCNSNIVMAATQAAEIYDKSKVHVVKAKTIAEGYSALSMMNLEGEDITHIISEMEECISKVKSGFVTTATRDVDYENISVKAGHYIGLDNNGIISDDLKRIDALRKLLKGTPGISENEVLVVFYGRRVKQEELDQVEEMLNKEFAWLEFGFIEGGQSVYDYILAIE